MAFVGHPTVGPHNAIGRPSGATNLVTNGGFETDTTGWTADGGTTLARTTSEAKFGSAAGSLDTAGGNKGCYARTTASASTQYAISCWVKATAGNNMRLWMRFFAASVEQPGLRQATNFVATGDWQRTTLTGTGDGSTDEIDVYPWMVEDGTFYVDGGQMEVGSVATPYIETDGASASRDPLKWVA